MQRSFKAAIVSSFHFFTLLCSIVLVRLTVPLPNIAIEVIKIVRGHIGNAVQLKEVCLRGQSPEHRQQPPRRHGWRGRSEPSRSKRHCTPRLGLPLSFMLVSGRPAQPGSVHHSPRQAKEERSVYCLVRRFEVTARHKKMLLDFVRDCGNGLPFIQSKDPKCKSF